MRANQTWQKTLSRNDAGETGGHQAGVYIFKKDWEFFAPLNLQNDLYERDIDVLTPDGRVLHWSIRWYRSRGEVHLTRCIPWFEENGISSGDVLSLTRINDSLFHINISGDTPSATEVYSSDLDTLSSPGKGRGQGFNSVKERRKATELFAMDLAKKHFEERGFVVTDMSATSPYDLRCQDDGHILYVEVKGTSTEGERIILTRNEVLFAQANSENCILFVVRNMDLVEEGGVWTATGGEVIIHEKWYPSEDHLDPIAYYFTLG